MDLTKVILRDRILDNAAKLDLFRYTFYISGIEVTQAVQYFDADQHLTDSADRGPDNSIRAVANKPAWARVYLASIFGSIGVSGTLEVQRRQDGFRWTTVATLSPSPPVPAAIPAFTEVNYATTRGTLGATLNFIIPADQMIGTLRLIARVQSAGNGANYQTVVTATLRQTLRLAGVMISYDGPASSAPNAPNLTLAAPILADLQAMSGTALTLFPVTSTADFRSAGSIVLTIPLQDTSFPTSGCGTNWDALHGRVANARTADGNQPGWIYYGLLPAGVPMGPVDGCGGGGVAVGPINQPGILAHEAGHACGLQHAPAGDAPNPDPNYPAYEPYDSVGSRMASTGEYGLNINNGNIAGPQTFRDFMAYGAPTWISLYHCRRLLQNARLNPVTVGEDSPWWKDLVWEEYRKWPWIPLPDPPPFDFDLELPMFPPQKPENVISLIVHIERNRVGEVMHVARTQMYTELEGTTPTEFTANLRSEDGKVLAAAPLRRLATAASGCSCSGAREPDRSSYLAQALIPDVAPGAALDITDGETIAWERRAPSKPCRIKKFEAKLDRKGGLRLTWDSSRDVVESWIRWSSDDEHWQSLATALTGGQARIDPDQLPEGKVMLHVVAHDGYYSTTSKAIAITLPRRGPSVAILHPVDGHDYSEGQTLRLWGSIAGAGGREVSPKRFVWFAGKKEIAQGLDTWVTLDPGRHKLTLRVEGSFGTIEVASTITVTSRRNADRSGGEA